MSHLHRHRLIPQKKRTRTPQENFDSVVYALNTMLKYLNHRHELNAKTRHIELEHELNPWSKNLRHPAHYLLTVFIWKKILRLSEDISNWAPSFQDFLSDPAQSALRDFIEDFSNWNPSGNLEKDLENFRANLLPSVSVNMRNLIRELKKTNLESGMAA